MPTFCLKCAHRARSTAGVANQLEMKSHISYCVTAKSHIIHKGIQKNYPIAYLRTYLCSATFIVNVTPHQHENNRSLPAIYCYACYLVELLAFLVLSNLLQIGLVFRSCYSKQFFYMGVSQYRSML